MESVVRIPVEEGVLSVSGTLHEPDAGTTGTETAVILAHGAGNDMTNPLLVAVCRKLAENGFPALRFNFPYKEAGKKAPDALATLVRTWRSAERFMREESGRRVDRLVAGGKSMGGRVASQMVAEWLFRADGLLFLGYPLHPPGKKDRLRDAHFYAIHIPMFFFAGTRDPLCDLGLLRGVLGRIETAWTLEIVEGGDHSFKVPKSAGLSQEDVYQRMAQKTCEWVRLLGSSHA
ncbi:MAG: dienelactone hydrolase family protein [Desulfobacteraceae bacterium]|jgi:predicted alpha/beta-hydrolase family hydrolase